jgi:Na+/H+ antiporter NhaD/arsenite permease-like protein
MNSAMGLAGVLAASIVAQAIWPAYRLTVMLAGAAVACLGVSSQGLAGVSQLFAQLPWNVLLILVALGLYARQLADSNLFGLASVAVTRAAGARPAWLMLLFTVGTYAVSGVVNNLTALMVVLPVLLTVFALVGVTARFAVWTLGLVLVACNLGGAATPIGDFPAILLLGKGAMTFADYLRGAAPPTLVALALLLGLVLAWVRPARDVPFSPLTKRLTLATLSALYRGTRLDMGLFAPAVLAFVLMLAGWLVAPPAWGLTPELVCWLGVGVALLGRVARAEQHLRRHIDVEAALFLLALFLMVGAVRQTGLFTQAGLWLLSLPLPPLAQVAVFLVAAAVLTGLFSAGPSMAALLEVAEVLSRQHSGEAIYVGLAISVCAGSSLFLTAATAGPLTQALVERARLTDTQGQPVRFGFKEYLPVGLLGFAVILAVGLVRTLWVLGSAGA